MEELKVIVISWLISLLTATTENLKTYIPNPTPTPSQAIQVNRVIDGDTFVVNLADTELSVRILGIDAPELNDKRPIVKCFANASKKQLSTLIENKSVILKKDAITGDKDKYGRLLRYIEVDQYDVGAKLIENGYANVYRQEAISKLNEYSEYESLARQRNLGLWGETCN